MALIKLGSIVTRISGKVGGQQFGTTAAGHYMKNSGTPRKAITLLQQTKMQRMSTTAQAWRQLSDNERATYKNASPEYPYLNRVGETKYYSGYAIFAMLRNNQANASISPTVNPLPKFSFTLPLSNTISKLGAVISWKLTGGQANISYRLFFTRPTSQGVTAGYQNHYFITASSSALLASGVVITAAITNKFGPAQVGVKYFWRVDAVHESSGQVLKGLSTGSFTF